MSEYTPDDEEWSTYALLNGKLEFVNDIIDAVEQEQDYDERFNSYRVLIRELDERTEDFLRTAKLLIDNGLRLTEATLYDSLKRYEKQLPLLELNKQIERHHKKRKASE